MSKTDNGGAATDPMIGIRIMHMAMKRDWKLFMSGHDVCDMRNPDMIAVRRETE